jgi:hypothetical protein
MTRILASAADAGRSCPYCRFPLKEGAPAERCDACGCLHDEDCWMDGNGCAVLGCVGAGTVVASAVAPAGAAVPTSPDLGLPASHAPSAQTAVSGTGGLRWLILACVIAVAGIAVGALLSTRVLSGGGKPVPVAAASLHPSAPVGSRAQQASARQAIMGILDGYQRDYSTHNLGGLSEIFSPQIKRHGLAAGGCSVVEGRSAVLSAYASQFAQGTGEYTLLGISASQIELKGSARAHLNANYRISPGGTGFVDFDFADEDGSWKVTQVYATCA